MPITPVDDPADPRLVELTRLTDAEARATLEHEHGCFVAEGLLALQAALGSAYRVRSVLVSEAKLARVEQLLEERQVDDVDVFVGSPELLGTVAGFRIHRGVVASVGRLPLPDPDQLVGGAERLLVLEAVNDHENLGALFRNAAAFGVDAVLLDPRSADPLYRRTVRVSVGHVLHVPWTRTTALPDLLPRLRGCGIATLALTPSGEVTVHDAARRRAGGRLAWIVGAEGPGLDDASLRAADERVRIPVAPGVDSLNVATAAAVALALSSRVR